MVSALPPLLVRSIVFSKWENRMKKTRIILAVLIVLAMLVSVTGCSNKSSDSSSDNPMVGEEVTYELKYEVQDGHLLIRYVNNDIFYEDDVFDSEFSFKDDNTMIIKDSFGEELTFVRK